MKQLKKFSELNKASKVRRINNIRRRINVPKEVNELYTEYMNNGKDEALLHMIHKIFLDCLDELPDSMIKLIK